MIANNLNPSGIAASCAEKLSVKFAEIQACPALMGPGGKWLMDYIGWIDRFQPVVWGAILFFLQFSSVKFTEIQTLSPNAGDLFWLDWSISSGSWLCFFSVEYLQKQASSPIAGDNISWIDRFQPVLGEFTEILSQRNLDPVIFFLMLDTVPNIMKMVWT